MTRLTEIEGIGEHYQQKLSQAGIASCEALLEQGRTANARQKLAEQCQVSPKLLLKWINRSDLARIRGIGGEYADLLEFAGVDSVPELAQRKPANLLAAMQTVNGERKLVRRLPTEQQITDWILQAKSLPRIVEH